jgi:hypothetical protein
MVAVQLLAIKLTKLPLWYKLNKIKRNLSLQSLDTQRPCLETYILYMYNVYKFVNSSIYKYA